MGDHIFSCNDADITGEANLINKQHYFVDVAKLSIMGDSTINVCSYIQRYDNGICAVTKSKQVHMLSCALDRSCVYGMGMVHIPIRFTQKHLLLGNSAGTYE